VPESPPSTPPTPPRDCREEPSYAEARDRLGDVQRLDDQLAGVLWGAVTNPGHFPVLDGSPFSLARTQATPGGPILRVYFTYDEVLVHLWGIDEVADPEADPAEEE